MRFLAYKTVDEINVGVVEDEVVYRLCGIDEFYADPYRNSQKSIDRSLGIALESLTQVPPVPRSSQILCIGLNYVDHIAETGRDRPEAPNIFARWYSSLSCQDAEVSVPAGEAGLDWEGELAVIIGKEMHDVDEQAAMDGVLGYTCLNDITARGYQRRTSQWALGKNAAGSGPIGPVVVTADELGDPYGLQLTTRYNGEVVQSATTDLMIFKIAEAISYASRCVTLHPGDVLSTGTPSGVGSQCDPVVLMTVGDEIEVEIEGIGVLRTLIV